jgi:hypothetical protein
MVNMGLAAPGSKHIRWHLLASTASMVPVVTRIIGGVFVGVTAHILSAGRLSVGAGTTIGDSDGNTGNALRLLSIDLVAAHVLTQ